MDQEEIAGVTLGETLLKENSVKFVRNYEHSSGFPVTSTLRVEVRRARHRGLR